MRKWTRQDRWTSGAMVLAAALATAAPATAQEARTIDESWSVDRDVALTVETVNRTVRVTGTDGTDLRVRGSYHPEYEEFALEGDGGSVTVTLKPREDREGRWDHDLGVDPLTVELPRGASLELDGVNGSAVVRDVDGAVSLETVNGRVDYRGASEDVEAATVNGGVTLRSAGGYVSAEAVSGDVSIRGDGPFDRVQAETISGDIEFHGRPAVNGSLDFETHSGAVDLGLPAELSARLVAEVFSGEIESEFGGEVRKESPYTPSRSYEQTVGSGDATVSAEAFSGEVRFRREGG